MKWNVATLVVGEFNHGPVPWRLGRPSSALLCPALVRQAWLTAAVFDLDLAPPGSRPLACDEGPSLRVMSLAYVDWSAVGLSLGNANRFFAMVQWSTRPESRKGVADIKVGLSTLFRDSQEVVTSIPVADVPSSPWESWSQDARAQARCCFRKWSQEQRAFSRPSNSGTFPSN